MAVVYPDLKVAIPATLLTHVLAAKVTPVQILLTFECLTTVRAHISLDASSHGACEREDRVFSFEDVLLALGYEDFGVDGVAPLCRCVCF